MDLKWSKSSAGCGLRECSDFARKIISVEDSQTFSDYSVTTNETPLAFIVSLSVYVGMVVIVVLLYAFYGQKYERLKEAEASAIELTDRRQTLSLRNDSVGTSPDSERDNNGAAGETLLKPSMRQHSLEGLDSQGHTKAESMSTPELPKENASSPSNIVVEQYVLSQREHIGADQHENNLLYHDSDRVSAVPSAATTSMLRTSSAPLSNSSSRRARPLLRTWDLTAIRWKHARPIGRVESMQRSVRAERRVNASEEDGSNASRSRTSGKSRRINAANPAARVTSDTASSFLRQQEIEGEAEYYRQRYLNQASARRQGSIAGSSDVSRMPGLSPDAVAPEDAADAHDVGTSLRLIQSQEVRWCCSPLLDLAEPDYEVRRIAKLATPSTISALADPAFRFVLAAIISHLIGTNSMIAFVLVSLFLRLTMDEVSNAINDAQTNMLHNVLLSGGEESFDLAGSYIMLSIVTQFTFAVPVLVAWVYLMDDTVEWLVRSTAIADVAHAYAQIIVIDHVTQAGSGAFMLVFHLTSHASFEKYVDVVATLLTIISVVVVLSSVENITLETVAWIQVIVGAAKAVVKVIFVIFKGWVKPYFKGLLSLFKKSNISSAKTLLRAVFPLLLGSLLELREWELLIFFVQVLGAAEVATWALMGIVWELVEAFSEGLAEASAIRVSYFLTEGMYVEAQRLTNKVMILALVATILMTSIFYILGPDLAAALALDDVLEQLFNQLVGITGVAGVAVSFAQVNWSLAGAQGRFLFASTTVLCCRWFVTFPLAAIVCFSCRFDLRAVAGAIAIGYASAAAILASRIYRSDWNAIATAMKDSPVETDFALDDDSSQSSHSSQPGEQRLQV